MAEVRDAGDQQSGRASVDFLSCFKSLHLHENTHGPDAGPPDSAKNADAEEEEAEPSNGSLVAAVHDPHRYRMDYPSIGTCLIINNKNFDRNTLMSTRNGTDLDSDAAKETFTNLGYKVRVANDQTVKQMRKLLQSVADEDHSQSASFVCVLLSHGDEGVIYGTDRFEKLENLTRYFKGYCQSLVGKPKLFFIQACRGSLLDEGTSVETDSVEEQTTERIPLEADFLYAYSTAPGYYSWRNTSCGSWFVQSLCDMLRRHSGEMELLHIMTRVNRQVALHFESSSSLPGFSFKKQIPCIVSMLRKDFYFHK